MENCIREYRNDRGITQSELARLVGARRDTIYNLENGRYNPSLSLALKIAHVFGVPVEDIFTIHLDPDFWKNTAQIGGSPIDT